MKRLEFKKVKGLSQWQSPGGELLLPSLRAPYVTASFCSLLFFLPSRSLLPGHLVLLAAARPGPCLPLMKKRSASGPVGARGHVGVSVHTGVRGQGACLPVRQGTPCPGTCHCMSRKSGKARIQCWTLQSVLWSELLVSSPQEFLLAGCCGAREEWVSQYALAQWGAKRSSEPS